MTQPLLRGRVYRIDLGDGIGLTPSLVVSNNRRNESLGDAMAVRITTTGKYAHLLSVADIAEPGSPMTGWAMCDDALTIEPTEVLADLGALTPAAMTRVARALAHVLGIAS